MAAGSQPLAFAELAFGGLLIASALTGEGLGELLTNGLTPAGKARLAAKQGTSNGLGSEGGPEPLGEPTARGGAETAPGGHVALSPSLAGKTVGKAGVTKGPNSTVKAVAAELERYLKRHLTKKEYAEVQTYVAEQHGREVTVRITPKGQLH